MRAVDTTLPARLIVWDDAPPVAAAEKFVAGVARALSKHDGTQLV